MSSYEDMLGRLERESLKKDQLVSSLAGAANTNPDDFARQIDLAKSARMSIDALPDYTEQAKQIKVLGTAGIDRIWKDSPVVANWLTDENNAKVAYDQVKEIGLVENATRKLGFFASGLTSDLLGGGIEGTGHILDSAWRRAVSGAAKLVLPTPEGGGTIDESSLAPTGIGEGFQAVGKGIQDLSKKYIEPTGPRSTADQVAAGLGQAAGQVGLMLLPGGQPAAAALMFGQGAKQQKDKIDMDKMSLQAPQSDQDWEVLTGGAITGVTEFLASKLMIKTPQAFALRSKMLDFSAKVALGAGEEAIQEFSENTLQDLAHIAMTNPESTVKWNEAVESGEIGAWVGGIMQAVINSALHIKTRGQQQAFKNLNDVAGAQALRDRSPDSFQNFADATAAHLAETTNGAVTDVYIDAQTFKQSLLDNGVNPDSVAAAVPSIAEQYNAALETNGDIVIPMNEWVGKVAGTEVGNMLYQHARSTAESLSMAESDTARNMAPEIQAQLEKFAASQMGNEEFKKSAKEVESTLFGEIKSTGRYSDTAARVYSQLVRDFYVVQAAKMGINPLELYNEKPYKIVNEGQTQAEPALSQVNTEDQNFKGWFGNSKTIDEEGKPMVMYHATPNNFSAFYPGGKMVLEGQHPEGQSGTAMWFSPYADHQAAAHNIGARDGGFREGTNVMPVYLKMERPLIIDNQEMLDWAQEVFAGGSKDFPQIVVSKWKNEITKDGEYDGIVFKGEALGWGPNSDEYIVFDPTQIKSIFNEGTFDPNNPDILKQSLSSRLPSAVKATEDPLGETLSINYDVTLSDPVTLGKNMAALMKTPNMRKLTGKGSKDPANQAEAFIDHVVNNLLWLHDHMPAEMRQRAEMWYDGGRKTTEVWADRYGISEMQGAAIIAVLSPQNGWFANVSQAERIADMVFGLRDYAWDDAMTAEAERISKEGGLDDRMKAAQGKTLGELLKTPDIAARWIRVYDQTYNNRAYRVLTPEGGAADYVKTNKGADATMMWKSYSTIAKAVSILMDGRAENVYYQLGREHKVRNFYNNLFAPNSPLGFTTIDTHAVAAALLRPLAASDTEVNQAFGSAGSASSSVTGLNGTYPIYLEAYKRAAEARGILPRQMQSITWEAVRGLFEAAKKSGLKKGADEIWNRYKKGEIDQAQAQQEILALAGDITPPSWTEVPFNDTVSRTYEGPAQKIIDERGPVGPAPADVLPKVFFEVAPDPNDAALTAQWNSLPEAEKSRISQTVAENIVPKVLAEVGTDGQFTMQIGGYEGATNPSMTLQVDRQELAITAAKLLGYALSQDSMMVVSEQQAVGMEPVGAISIDLPAGYGEAEVRGLYDRLWELEQDGQKLVGGHTTVDGHMVILNYSGLDNHALALIIDQHLGGEFTVRENTVYSAFPNKEDYNYAGDIEQAPARGAPAETRANNLRAEATELLRNELGSRGILKQSGIGGGQRLRAGDQTVRSSYGTARDGSSSVVGIHYSRQSRGSLSGDFYTTGLKGGEFARLQQSDDQRLLNRIHFYVDTGAGVKPESGVGAYAHAIQLNNLYNTDEDPLGLLKAAREAGGQYWFNNFESSVIDAGFDGVYVPKAQGDQGVAVLLGEHKNVGVDQLGNNMLRQNDIFYSALQRAFENVKQGTMPADQWLKWLSSNQAKLGVKKEEIEATGLREYLELNGNEKLTKEQISEFLRENGVKVDEVIYGDQDKYWNKVYNTLESGGEIAGYKWDDQNEDLLDNLDFRVEGVSDLMSAADYVVNRTTDTDAEYAQYQLPGGQKYKELLITLPREAKPPVVTVVENDGLFDVMVQTAKGAHRYDNGIATRDEAEAVAAEARAKNWTSLDSYQSPHWSESNVLAHIRFNERTDADGKRVLFIEELQSDWAQAGRKHGFNKEAPAKETAAKEAYDAYVSTLKERYIDWYDKEFADEISSQDRRRSLAASQADNMSARQLARGVDDIDTFNKLALDVVEETGRNTRAEKAAKTGIPDAPFVKDTKSWVGLAIKRMIRYAADKGFDKVAFVNGKQSADRYSLEKQVSKIDYVKNEDGTYEITVHPIGGASHSLDDLTESQLEDYVGKEIAERIASGVGTKRNSGLTELYGIDLKVGGEGMKTFYDKIVPQVANDVLKKLGGGKVETIKVNSFELDENMDEVQTTPEQLGFTITPEMRDAALAGQTLFQPMRGGFDPQRLTTILTEKADYSTFLHETAHFFLTVYADMAGSENATSQMRADMQTILDWFNIKDLATWNAMSLEEQRKYHEQFAYNYEIYLFEGKAPSTKMQSLFDKFTAWLKRVYKSIRDELNTIYRQEHGEDLPILTGEVRDVMDRMLATDEQIKQAEKVRSMAPSFQTQEQAGVDDATWAAYQELAQEATNASLHDLATASLRQMKWLENARSRIIKDIQRSARETRRAMQEEVAKEVDQMPEFAAQAALREAKDDTEKAAILDTYGFKSQADLKAKLAETGKKADVIRKITDQRMLEEHSDFYDKSSIQIAIERALHNEARARFIAVELRMLSKAQTPVRVMQEAAKQAARSILMNRPLSDLKEKAFVASEARAARQVMESIKRDDLPSAINASRAQLLNNQLAAQTLAIKSDFAKSMELFKKLFRKDDKLAATRDINFISVARAILANYGLGKSEQPPSFYLEKIKAYDPEFYAEIEPMITAHLQQAKPVTQLTVAEFQDLADQIKALWHLSGRLKKNDVDGKLVDRKEIVAELNAAIAPMLTGKERIGYDKAITDWQDTKMGLLGIRASLRRVESWVDAMDQGKADGPFRKYIWNPISEAVTQFRIAKVDYIKKYLDIMQAEEGRLDEGSINAPEIGYTFKNKAELLHAILHTGNESNKRKLLLGRNWGALNEETNTLDTGRWDRMIERMQKDGTLTKQDYDFAQKVWDLLEEMKPAAQKAHHQMYGFYFNEITANPVVTPFGTYRGGYVPAVSDSRLNTDQAVNNEKETEQGNNSYMFPTTGRGFTKGRVEYNKPLLLDLGFLPSHIDKVLRFTYIEPRVKEVGKLVKNREFGEMIDQLDPSIRKDMLMPWLQRTAMQAIQTPSKGEAGRRLDKIFSELRTRTGMQAMVGNFVNAIQQFTGFSIAALKVKPKYLKMATVMYIKDPKGTANAVSEASAYMRTRMNSQMFEMTKTIDQLLINPTKYDKLRQFAEKNGYFLQQGTQNIVDTIVWTGAYNESVESGMDQKDAVRAADAAVRQTQGSFSPEDVSRAEAGSAFVRMFLMFYSYFNMQANLLGTEFGKVARELGVRKGAGKMFYIYAMGFMIPAVMSELMVQAAGGFDDGDDDEYDWTDALRMFVGSQFRSAAAMIPGIGAAANAAVNMANKKPYDDRISTSPVVTNLEGALRAPVSLYQAIAKDESWKQAARDVLTMLGLITRLPLGQVAKPVGYAADVAQGKINPESPMDVARGVISGKDVNRRD